MTCLTDIRHYMKNYFLYIISNFQKIIYVIIFVTYSLLFITPLIPCNVPVFRYALERWTADPYRLMVFHHGQADHINLLEDLKQLSFQGDSTINLVIQYSDLDKISQNPLQGRDDNLTYPLIMLFYPEQTGIPYPVWMGELTRSNIDLLTDSPIRNEISNLLLTGKTAVFLFLESGNSELDQKYYDRLKQELEALSTKIKIPTTGMDIDGNPIEVDDFQNVDLNFSIKKVSRRNPSEKIFVDMLFGTESDLSEYRVPLVFPVFGQGRSLYALVGAGINKNTIEKACQSLVDWCSCEIKALHQGVDLLFLAKWSEKAGETWIKGEDLTPLKGFSGFISSSDKVDDITEQANENESDRMSLLNRENPDRKSAVQSDSARQILSEYETVESFSVSKNIGWLLLILIAVVIIISYMIKNRIIRVKR